jgi:hypothetical protein
MFGKSINTKVDNIAAFRRSIDLAITAAKDGHVHTNEIVGYLRSRATAIGDQDYRGPYTPPRMYDGFGQPVDLNAKVEAARRERQRIADEASVIPPHLRQSAASGYRVP